MTSQWIRRGAIALAAARIGVGVAALASPALIARPWVGGELALRARLAAWRRGCSAGRSAAGTSRSGSARSLRCSGRSWQSRAPGQSRARQEPRRARGQCGAGASGPGPARWPRREPRGARGQCGARASGSGGALADSLDVLATAAAWDELPAGRPLAGRHVGRRGRRVRRRRRLAADHRGGRR